MNLVDRFVRTIRPLVGMCAFIFVIAMLLPRAEAQEILRLPEFPVEDVEPDAANGDREALYILGTLYFKGELIETKQGDRKLRKRLLPDFRKAAAAFTRAAEQGLGLAQLHLAEMYYDGTKVPQNDELAFRWYQTAALQGIPMAQYGLGNVYAQGRGTEENLQEAAYWYEQAAMQGHAQAQSELGLLYATGTGVPLNLLIGYKWLALAAAQGHPDAATARDEVRNGLTPSDIADAQRNAAIFKATLHYGDDEQKRQKAAVVERAKDLLPAK